MRRGKEIAQGCHVSMAWLLERVIGNTQSPVSDHTAEVQFLVNGFELSKVQWLWMRNQFRKVTLQVESEKALIDLHARARQAGVESHLVHDAGLTEVPELTLTALAIGPDYSAKIDPITGELKLY